LILSVAVSVLGFQLYKQTKVVDRCYKLRDKIYTGLPVDCMANVTINDFNLEGE
jgi:hypothetical protein